MSQTSSPELVFAFEEDGSLNVYDSISAAAIEYEGVDVENGTVRFYDRRGINLEPVFTTPNTSGKTFGILPWVLSGAYQLVPNSGSKEGSFALALSDTRFLTPNPWFASLAQLKSVLSNEGVIVELGASGL